MADIQMTTFHKALLNKTLSCNYWVHHILVWWSSLVVFHQPRMACNIQPLYWATELYTWTVVTHKSHDTNIKMGSYSTGKIGCKWIFWFVRCKSVANRIVTFLLLFLWEPWASASPHRSPCVRLCRVRNVWAVSSARWSPPDRGSRWSSARSAP